MNSLLKYFRIKLGVFDFFEIENLDLTEGEEKLARLLKNNFEKIEELRKEDSRLNFKIPLKDGEYVDVFCRDFEFLGLDVIVSIFKKGDSPESVILYNRDNSSKDFYAFLLKFYERMTGIPKKSSFKKGRDFSKIQKERDEFFNFLRESKKVLTREKDFGRISLP